MSSRLLLDSHELIWVLFEPERIGKKSERIILAADEVLVSIVSIWELALKHNKGRLAYSPEELLDGADALGAKLISIESSHVLELNQVNTLHKDPFDRMLLAQAKTEGLSLLTADAELLKLKLDYVIDARN